MRVGLGVCFCAIELGMGFALHLRCYAKQLFLFTNGTPTVLKGGNETGFIFRSGSHALNRRRERRIVPEVLFEALKSQLRQLLQSILDDLSILVEQSSRMTAFPEVTVVDAGVATQDVQTDQLRHHVDIIGEDREAGRLVVDTYQHVVSLLGLVLQSVECFGVQESAGLAMLVNPSFPRMMLRGGFSAHVIQFLTVAVDIGTVKDHPVEAATVQESSVLLKELTVFQALALSTHVVVLKELPVHPVLLVNRIAGEAGVLAVDASCSKETLHKAFQIHVVADEVSLAEVVEIVGMVIHFSSPFIVVLPA